MLSAYTVAEDAYDASSWSCVANGIAMAVATMPAKAHGLVSQPSEPPRPNPPVTPFISRLVISWFLGRSLMVIRDTGVSPSKCRARPALERLRAGL